MTETWRKGRRKMCRYPELVYLGVGALRVRALSGFSKNSKGSVAGDERVRAQWEEMAGEPISWKHMQFMLSAFDFIMNERGRLASSG